LTTGTEQGNDAFERSREGKVVDRLRVGTLGAARITPAALIKPARQVPEVANMRQIDDVYGAVGLSLRGTR